MWNHRHLLGIAELSRDDMLLVLDTAERWFAMPRDEAKNARVLHGRTVINLFFESSTRTRTSFEVAGKRLGADVVNVSAQTSSVTKGETLLDTVRNLEALRADAIVLRHPASGAPDFVAARTKPRSTAGRCEPNRPNVNAWNRKCAASSLRMRVQIDLSSRDPVASRKAV